MAEAISVVDLQGESVLKRPGDVNGESVVIKNLTDCSVYLLDYASEVEVSNCVNCSIFVGPVDGPAIFDGCTGCKVAVASQQFQAKGCTDCTFGLYCATQPSLSSCSSISIGCWVGAYPGLSGHFSAANLDPKANNWSKVYDGSAEDGSAPNFSLLPEGAPPTFWEVPLEGAGPCDNPVPAPDGSAYAPRGGDAPQQPSEADLATAAAFPHDDEGEDEEGGGGQAGGGIGAPLPEDMFGGAPDALPENGFVPPPAPEEEDPRVAAMRDAQRSRLKEQEAAEVATKEQARARASEYLSSFYERRNAAKEARLASNREHGEAAPLGPSMAGDTPWERVVSLIDFQFARPNGADLARFKGALYGAKSKNVVPSLNGAGKPAAAPAE